VRARQLRAACPETATACPETATACPEHGQTVTEMMGTIIIKSWIKFSDSII